VWINCGELALACVELVDEMWVTRVFNGKYALQRRNDL
jgi:hypothetical protein